MKKVLESDASLTGLVWGGIGAASDAVGNAVSGGYTATVNIIGGVASGMGEVGGGAAKAASETAGRAYATLSGLWGGKKDEL